MNARALTPARPLPLRALGLLKNLVIGILLCFTPLTALLALGWLTRRMGASVAGRWGQQAPPPGWLLGPRGAGRIARAAGGLAANIRSGVITALGLAMLTLPFTALWLGAWWAGWENSFNKGYEQAGVGPSVWMLGGLISLPLLAHLPLALAHAAAEDRLGAFFEWRRIRSIAAAAGWRLPALALTSVIPAMGFLGLRVAPVFIEDIVPGFAAMTAAEQVQVADTLGLLGAALAFTMLLVLRHWAAVTYAGAAPRAAAGRHAALWHGHVAAGVSARGRTPSRVLATFWVLLACAIWIALPVQLVVGQFMNYDAVLWLTHPLFLLPWAG